MEYYLFPTHWKTSGISRFPLSVSKSYRLACAGIWVPMCMSHFSVFYVYFQHDSLGRAGILCNDCNAGNTLVETDEN